MNACFPALRARFYGPMSTKLLLLVLGNNMSTKVTSELLGVFGILL